MVAFNRKETFWSSQLRGICPFSCCLYVEELAAMNQVLGPSSMYIKM